MGGKDMKFSTLTAATALAVLAGGWASAQQTIMPTTQIAKFAQELPLLGSTGLPVRKLSLIRVTSDMMPVSRSRSGSGTN